MRRAPNVLRDIPFADVPARGMLALFSLVAVEPFRSGLSDITGSMLGAGGNEKLFADPEPILSSTHFEFFFAFDQHH
jgi:hypothetical protein